MKFLAAGAIATALATSPADAQIVTKLSGIQPPDHPSSFAEKFFAEQVETMTNGTVKQTSDAGGLTLTVDYGKGEKTIHVPADVPVVGIVPADSSKLVPGAHVFVSTKKDTPGAAAAFTWGACAQAPSGRAALLCAGTIIRLAACARLPPWPGARSAAGPPGASSLSPR